MTSTRLKSARGFYLANRALVVTRITALILATLVLHWTFRKLMPWPLAVTVASGASTGLLVTRAFASNTSITWRHVFSAAMIIQALAVGLAGAISWLWTTELDIAAMLFAVPAWQGVLTYCSLLMTFLGLAYVFHRYMSLVNGDLWNALGSVGPEPEPPRPGNNRPPVNTPGGGAAAALDR